MKAITVTLIAIASTVAFGAAKADPAPATETIVVTAKRAELPNWTRTVATDKPADPSIDFMRLTIEAPRLDPTAVSNEPRRAELAVGKDANSKS